MTQAIASQKPFEAERDTASPNRNLAPVTTGLDERDRLMVGGCVLSELAQRYGTPLYCWMRKRCVAPAVPIGTP